MRQEKRSLSLHWMIQQGSKRLCRLTSSIYFNFPIDKIIRLLGQGTFGKVVQCLDRESGRYCAIKIIRAVQKYRDASKIEARVLTTLKKNDPRNS